MIVTIHQPEHLPWLGFCHKATQAEIFVLLDNVQYRKNYFQNRNRILGANGPLWVTVPVLQRGHTQKTIGEMEIDNDGRWRRKWWMSIYHAYGRAPFFERYGGFFEALMDREWRYLADLNEEIIRFLFDALNIRCRLLRASTLPVEGSRSELLLAICRHLGAGTYLAGQHGREYLDEELFKLAGVSVMYHAFEHPRYPQGPAAEFVPNLSVVDLLFRHGPRSRAILAGTEGREQ